MTEREGGEKREDLLILMIPTAEPSGYGAGHSNGMLPRRFRFGIVGYWAIFRLLYLARCYSRLIEIVNLTVLA